MLDRARKTVLAIVNKENRGWITPSQSDLFFNQAQLEIFEDYFSEYAKYVYKANSRITNSGYSDLPKLLREKIEVFSAETNLTYSDNMFNFPEDMYYVTELHYDDNEIEEVDKRKMNYLKRSSVIAPTAEYPAYTTYGRRIKVLPESIVDGVTCSYLRRPLAPKWTYVEIGGNPVFNPSANDYQDLEIHPSDEVTIVHKVLSYAGINIREEDIVKIMNQKDVIDLQQEKI